MNHSSPCHLVILLEEKVSRLSEAVTYSSPDLPHPFVIKAANTADNFVSSSQRDSVNRGNRTFSTITLEYYTFEEVSRELRDNLTGQPHISSDMAEGCPDSATIVFHSGNPVVETTEGIVHVYKNDLGLQASENGVTSTMLCIFSVPSHVTVKDLLNFVSPMRESIEELKVVKAGGPHHYMALLKFRSQRETNQFYRTYNNTCYRNLESEICQLMYVSHVEKTHPSKGTAFPTKDLLELPSCPVCLERLDEPVQGILTTILCNHTFHDACIARVEDSTCPVCRYVQSPELRDDSQCADCCIRENLWICLICGRIGCGRYGRKHAQRHFEETGHTFALELGKNLVWDYADDSYVHRLAVNHEDGKLVQLGPGSETGDKKLDMISMEFSAVLTSQLDSQRAYFEAQLEQVSMESANRIQAAEAGMEEAVTKVKALQKQLSDVKKEKDSLSRKLQQVSGLAQRLQKELAEEQAVNQSLANNEAIWRSRAERAEAEMKVAQEECRELLLNLEFRSKLDQLASSEQLTASELENSEISIHPPASSSRRRKKR
ncbi:unnamed protein product [Dicrocoelium dendriticum]|nr:unnamed protein product [Dicrocoelium dendriticum]